MIAKQVVKGKFWVVEKEGEQVATIQSHPEGITFVYKEKREQFVSIKMLKDKYNIVIASDKPKSTPEISSDVYGFPCDHEPHNILLNVVKKLPVYTKSSNSKSIFCAGYYLVKYKSKYSLIYCPKLIYLEKYEFIGPFKTSVSAKTYLSLSKDV
jgi:hypothetical protein